ncbi:MAG: response regulator [Methylobacteriaceae bacterium]|nr:response regulator [Methylobacteriaceae bacterium]
MKSSAVLIVDDEPLIRETVSELLSGAGLSILEATNGDEALEMLSRRGHMVAVLLTDVRMPGEMNGIDLARLTQSTWPWIKVIVMSGFYERGPEELPRNARFISKPWQPNEVINNVLHAASEFAAIQPTAALH